MYRLVLRHLSDVVSRRPGSFPGSLLSLQSLGKGIGIAVTLAALAAPVQADETHTLRLSSWGAPTAPQVSEFTKAFKTEVEKASGGRIAVQVFPAGSLVNERAVPSAVQSGVVDISLTTMGSWASIVPTAGALNTVFFRPTAENFDKVIGPDTPLFKALDDDMAKHGARLLAALYNGPVVVVSKTPLKSPADFKGKTVRVFDRLTAEIVQSLKSRNIGVLIISHSLDQVFKLSDRICVLLRGRQIGIRETAKTDKNEIVSMITGVAS